MRALIGSFPILGGKQIDFQERLLDELEELNLKIYKLSSYISESNNSENEEKRLENQQLEIMLEYKDILRRRIINLMK